MPKLADQTILYHGSYCEVTQPELSKCAKYKDFGQGFYLTTSKEQARNFAKISTYRAIDTDLIPTERQFGIISIFHFVHDASLQIHDFPTSDAEWLHCVVGHRRKGIFADVIRELQGTDIISGKIANDDTNATIIAYMTGVFGEMGSESADRMCISLLLPDRLKDQFCFRTEKALASLIFEGSEKVWL